MSDPVGVGGGRSPPGQERAKLVAELGRYLAAWEQRLRAPSAGGDVGGVREWSADLQVRARAVGFGGVAHHLSRCQALIGGSGPLDVASLSAALKDLSELAWQAKQELPLDERAQVDRILEEGRQSGAPPSSLEPPPMLTVHPALRRGAAGPSQNPPPAAPGATRPPLAAPAGGGVVEPPRIVSPIPPPPPGVRAPAVGPNSGFDASRPAAGAPQPVFERPAPLPPAPPDRAPVAENPPSDRPRPNLAVRTMFRLRAFGQAAAPPAPDPPLPPAGGGTPPPGGASPLLGLRGFSHPPPAPGAGLPGPGGSGLPGGGRAVALPALGGGPGALPPLGGGGHPGMGSAGASGSGASGAPPLPGLGGGASGTPGSPKQAMPRYLSNSLPPLPEGGEARVPTPGDSRLSDLIGRGGSKRESASRARRDSKSVKAVRRREAPGSGFPWWLGVLAALCAAVLTLVAVLSWNRLRTPADKARAAGSAAGSSAAAPSATASGVGPVVTAPTSPRLRTPSDEALEDLRVKAHGKGTKDSPELNAWVDHQAALQAKLLQTGKCEGSSAACAILYRPGEDTGSGRITPRKPSSPKAVRSRWMAGLRMPSIPVEDDVRVQRIFERLTDTPTGREQVSQILFRCGAYKDLIQATLIRYDLPPSLLAVVFAESGCSPTIKSPVGAEGLWQFMPESGRAYHLHITEAVLDERHSPQKSTEAAVHFLADLYAKFGSWDLAFAAYNMGPYGLYARQQRAGGGDVGFWDLLDADLLPGETSNYVPIIEAYALILENLQKLKFASVQMRSPEVTADLDAPPGTRIGLIARAASTSINQIRSMNLDLKADVIPTIPGQRFTVQVPKDNVWQARDQLDELIAQGSYDDQCVADNFDWGKQPFNKEMRDDCRRRLGAPAPAGRSSHTP